MKILLIAGTRPEYIKLAPLYLELKAGSSARRLAKDGRLAEDRELSIKWVISNQHSKELLADLIEFWGINIDAEFNLSNTGLDLAELSAELLIAANQLIKAEQPDLIIIQGDTLTALEVARAAFFNQVPIAHLEAGLRTESILTPFPEEFSRRVISEIATYHFCPTVKAYETLLSEKKNSENIFMTGNTVIDALFITLKSIAANCKSASATGEAYVLVTSHRRENLENGMQARLIESIKNILFKQREFSSDKKVKFFICLHSNPRAREAFINLRSQLAEEDKPNLKLIERPSYLEFIELMLNSLFIITDSGGVQEEAPYLEKQLLVLRELSEREEILGLGSELLLNDARQMEKQIMALIDKLLEKYSDEDIMLKVERVLARAGEGLPFGDGRAAWRVLQIIFKEIDTTLS